MKSILIIEDDLTFSRILKAWFVRRDFSVETVVNGSETRKKIKENTPEVVICDLRLPGESGLSILEWIKAEYPKLTVIMMTGFADIQSAVKAMKLGAFDYIPKPFNPEELFRKINEAFHVKEERDKQIANGTSVIDSEYNSKYVRGISAVYENLYEFVNLVAPTKLAVMINGESGVGKEHIARLMHDKSSVACGPFVAVDCGVLSKELAASDFFGHVKGAFTGAVSNKTGYFVQADKGTLFLDEIGNLPVDIQMQLLRVLQEKKVKPVGSEKEIEVDIRLITATNEDIDFAVSNGYFRNDLYHRISEFIIHVPSLRECREDIPTFLYHFLKESNQFLNKNVESFTPEAIEIFCNYDWPGNIREVKNIINRLTLIATSDKIDTDIVPEHFKLPKSENNLDISNEETVRIKEALRIAKNNLSKAADILEIDPKILHNKIKVYKISNEQ